MGDRETYLNGKKLSTLQSCVDILGDFVHYVELHTTLSSKAPHFRFFFMYQRSTILNPVGSYI
jgi:hypothetical protein